MAKCGQPTKYTPELAAEICAAVATTAQGLEHICKRKGMPSPSSVYLWLTKFPEFSENYARAREQQGDLLAYQAVMLADTVRKGRKLKLVGCTVCGASGKCPICKGEGHTGSKGEEKGCAECDAGGVCAKCHGRGGIQETTTGDMVERARLQVDTRKWMAGKLAPKRYGDRLELAGDKTAPLGITIVRMDRPKP